MSLAQSTYFKMLEAFIFFVACACVNAVKRDLTHSLAIVLGWRVSTVIYKATVAREAVYVLVQRIVKEMILRI